MRIAALCPSRGRPDWALRLENSYRGDVLFYLDDDDPSDYAVRHAHTGPVVPVCYAWNILWQQNPGYDAYIPLGDDCVFKTQNIPEMLEVPEDGIWVAGVHDGIEDGAFATPIISARFAKELGFIINPMFIHWFGDTWAVGVAKSIGRFIDISDRAEITHLHQKAGAPKDETYHRIRQPMRYERDYFVGGIQRYFRADVLHLADIVRKS